MKEYARPVPYSVGSVEPGKGVHPISYMYYVRSQEYGEGVHAISYSVRSDESGKRVRLIQYLTL